MTASTRRGDALRDPVTSPLDGLLAGLRLALFPAGTEADVAALSSVVEWHTVSALARRHRVAGLLLRGLRTRPHLLAATGIEPKLRALHDRAIRRGWRQLGALKRATDRLAASDVPCLVLKGLPLSQRIHGHPLVRDSLDIDLLVAPEMHGSAKQGLLDDGWKLVSGFRETPARNRWHGRVAADCAFIGRSAKVELHSRLCHNPHHLPEGFEYLRACSVVVNIGTAAFRTLGEDDEFLYLACHGTRHGWPRLDWLCDVAALLARMPPGRLERIAARCREMRLDVVLSCTLQLSNAAFHIELPAPLAGMREEHATGMTRPAGSKRAAFITAAASRTWCHRNSPALWRQLPLKLALKLLLKPDWRYVRHEMLAVLIAPRDWVRIDLPDKLFFLYFPLQPLLWLTQQLGGWGRAHRRGSLLTPSAGEREERVSILRAGRPRSRASSDEERGEDAPITRTPAAGGNGEVASRTKRPGSVIIRFFRAPVRLKTMALEAALFLLLAWLLVEYIPMRRWRHRLTTAEEAERGSLQPEGRRLARKVARVVRRVARRAPFPAVCLPQAMAAQWMLRRRRIPSRLFFGARRRLRPESAPHTDGFASGMDFHAWLTIGDDCVLGGAERDTYVALPPIDNVA